MIDGVKLSFYSEDIKHNLSCLGVDVTLPVSNDTGELKYPLTAYYKHLHLKICKSHRVQVCGSLHKYLKGENYSDFTFMELSQAIETLCRDFRVAAREVQIHNLEFGVNILLPYSPHTFCARTLAHKTECFNKIKPSSRQRFSIGADVVMQQYRVKVYDKGKQCGLSENILRFELAVSRMEFLQRTGIMFLADLQQLEKIKGLGQILNAVYSKILFLEEINTKDLTKPELTVYAQCINPRVWESFKPDMRCKRKRAFEAILRAKGKTSYKREVGELITLKWQFLSKNGNDLTGLCQKKVAMI